MNSKAGYSAFSVPLNRALRCADRERCFCSSMAFWKPSLSTVNCASCAICSVKSIGKPNESYKKNAWSPETTVCWFSAKVSFSSVKYLIPRSNMVLNDCSSSCIISIIRSCAAINSGYDGPNVSTTTGMSEAKNPDGAFNTCCPYRVARRNIRRKTYPRPSLLGTAPSAIANDNVRAWSAIAR